MYDIICNGEFSSRNIIQAICAQQGCREGEGGVYGLCLWIFGLPFNNPNQLVEKYMEELILKVVEWLDSGLTNYVLYNHPIHIPPLKHFQ